MRVFKIDYSVKGFSKTEWVKAHTNIEAIRSISNKLQPIDKLSFKIASIQLIKLDIAKKVA